MVVVVDERGHKTVPLEEYEALHRTLEEISEELAESRSFAKGLTLKLRNVQRELDDLLEQSDDAEPVKTIIAFWKKVSGRRAVVRLDGDRARVVRRMRRKWSDRDLCLMIVGYFRDEQFAYSRRRGYTDLTDVFKFEDTMDKALDAGRRLKGEDSE